MKRKVILGAMGLAIRGDKFLLTQRHQPDISAWHLKWNIPGGGVEFAEDPLTALHREFWEELRIKPKLLLPLPLPVNIVWYGKDTGFDHDFHLMMHCYAVDIGDQAVDISHDPEHETRDFRWFTLAEAKKVETLPQTISTIENIFHLLAQ